jgi:hypothetical protein
MKTATKTPANARKGAFAQIAQLPKDCRWARMRLRGWNDYAKGRGFRDTYDTWHRKSQFAYERGRMQAALTVRSMTLLNRAGNLPLWTLDEYIEGPMYRALGDHAAVRKIVEETRVARKVPRDKASKGAK